MIEKETKEITKVEDRRRDSGSKSIFRDKGLIAEMLIGITDEFRDMERDEVINCLCLDPADGSVKDLNGELSLSDAGLARLDTLIEAVVPGTDDRVRVRFNVECQRRFSPGYDLYDRAQFYAGMLIATQNKELTSVARYKNLKSIYTVWVCLETDTDEAKGTITRYGYRLMPSVGKERTYDRLKNKSNLVVVCLDDCTETYSKDHSRPKVIGILNTIFSGNMCDEERKNELRKIFKLDIDLLLIREARVMTDLLQEEYDMGKEDGFVEGKIEGKIEGKTEQCVETILMLINEKGFDRKTAIELANVPNECREEVFSQLNTIIGC